VTVTRARGTVAFPASFILVATRNPCPCGYFGDPHKRCICPQAALRNYRTKLSGPVLDRIDMRIDLPRLHTVDLLAAPTGPPTHVVRKRVATARRLALERQGVENRRL